MKQLIIIAVIAIAGFALYQYYNTTYRADEGNSEEEYEEPAQTIPSGGGASGVPDACGQKATSFENAFYGYQTSEVSVANYNTALRGFRSCLSDSGLSDSDIDAIIEESKTKVKGYLKMDGKG